LARARTLRDAGNVDDAKQAFDEAYKGGLLTREYSVMTKALGGR